MKLLIFDIETSPNIAYVWRFFKENISPKQVKENTRLLSFAGKWLGDQGVMYEEDRTDNDKRLVKLACELLDEADIAVAHNGGRFDIPQIRARALVHGLTPPSPVKIIDTYQVARREFNFPSNSLEYLTEVLGCETKKGGHKKFPGFELWLECLKGNPEAWEELRYYNIQDVIALEELYLKMLPWITNHPNLSVRIDPSIPLCPKCGSSHIHRRGNAYISSGSYPRFQCQSCGGWSRGRYRENKKNENVLGNLV